MPALELPKGKTLYDILQLEKETADETSIKKAYRRLALKYHPDKQTTLTTEKQKEIATHEFQLIGLAYSILSDKGKKANYDRTGSLKEESWLNEDKDWNDYFKALWTGVVNDSTITTHLKAYKESKEEEEDVLKYYTQAQGNMNTLLNYVMHSDVYDVPRFITIIQRAIDDNRVEHYRAFTTTTTASAQARRIRQAEKEKMKAEKEKERRDAKKNQDSNMDGGEEEQLKALIMAKRKDRWNQIENMLDGIMDRVAASVEEQNAKTRQKSKKNNKKQQQQPYEDDVEIHNNNDDDDDDQHHYAKKSSKSNTPTTASKKSTSKPTTSTSTIKNNKANHSDEKTKNKSSIKRKTDQMVDVEDIPTSRKKKSTQKK
ncbi:hypothetical protein BJ944DRAFT_290788 [Cunninghamella echinulata]|nr:hypothetical protein BJ944DRAFT_290788 [Cunninghamella echinulata]